MTNKNEVRQSEFAMRKEWAEKFSSADLKKMLEENKLHAGEKTAAKEVLRLRGDL